MRPTYNKRNGTLYPVNYTTKDASKRESFDIIRIPFTRYKPKYHHPENWLIHYSYKWQILGQASLEEVRTLIGLEIQKDSCELKLLGNSDKLISYEDLQSPLLRSSLAMINLEVLEWEIKYNSKNKKTSKCLLRLCSSLCYLQITDSV
ncbi:dual OB domain-containing protein [Trichormus azollae]|uniref:dual OB domain-containing protein n=1 Tax=Trichormus azollae TaxID=1164 RepID=UPI00325E1074